MRDLSAAGHGVPRVHGEVQQGQLQLVGVDLDSGKGLLEAHRDLHPPAKGAAQQRRHAADQGRQVHHLRRERLAAAEREQALRQGRAPLGTLDGVCEQARGLRVLRRQALAEQRQAAEHGGEQVVEVVRDPAGQLPDRLHLLGVAETRLGGAALGHLRPQLRVHGVQLACAPRQVEAKAHHLPEVSARALAGHDQRREEHGDHGGGGGAVRRALQGEPDGQGEASRQDEGDGRREVRVVQRGGAGAHAADQEGPEQLVGLGLREQQDRAPAPHQPGGERAACAGQRPAAMLRARLRGTAERPPEREPGRSDEHD